MLRFLKRCVQLYHKTSLLDAKCPWGLEEKNKTYLKMRTIILTFSWWRKISPRIGEPSTGRNRKGKGDVCKIDYGIWIEIAWEEERICRKSGLRQRGMRNGYEKVWTETARVEERICRESGMRQCGLRCGYIESLD
jgi:hypothetical protein